jgi:hypothetical protein
MEPIALQPFRKKKCCGFFYRLNKFITLKRESVRKDIRTVDAKRRRFGKAKSALYLVERRKSILLEGTQAMPARPSDKDIIRVKALEW